MLTAAEPFQRLLTAAVRMCGGYCLSALATSCCLAACRNAAPARPPAGYSRAAARAAGCARPLSGAVGAAFMTHCGIDCSN